MSQERELLESAGHIVDQFLVANPTGSLHAVGALALAPWNPRAARTVVEAADTFAPDVVHVHNTWFALSPSVFSALHRRGHKVVTTLHNYRSACVNGVLLRDGIDCTRCVGSHSGHAIVHRCYRNSFVLSTAAALTVTTARRAGVWRDAVDAFFVLDDAATPLLSRSGIPADRIVVRPHFVDDPGPRAALPSASRDVVYVGRLSEEKGIGALLQAWRETQPAHLTLHIYGDGPLRPLIEHATSDQLVFHGTVSRSEAVQAMAKARALVFPSLCREGGLAPVEALATGTPLVLSDLVSMSERVVRTGAGWSGPAGDISGLADVLSRLEADDSVDGAGANARALYEERHLPRQALAILETIYEAGRHGTSEAERPHIDDPGVAR